MQLFHFTADGLSNVTLRTFSYAGGTNGAGQAIVRGGFDPILALFDSLGDLVGQNDDDLTGTVPGDAVTGRRYDTLFTEVLAAGTYTVAVMQYNNFAGDSLSDGFSRQGQGNFTGPAYDCSQGYFCDITGDNRLSHWAFDISGVETADVAPVPLPAALPLLASGLAGLGFVGWRRKRKGAAAV